MVKRSFLMLFNAGPLILLYYLCISEVDTNLEKIFEIFTSPDHPNLFLGIKTRYYG